MDVTIMEENRSLPKLFLTKNWWSLALRGFVAIVFGLLAFAWPEKTLILLITFFGAYALVDGLFALTGAFAGEGGVKHGWGLLLEGLAGIAIGVLVFIKPGLTAVVLLYFIAIWALVTGNLKIIAGIVERKVIPGYWLLIIGGFISDLFGLALLSSPEAGALALIWLIGIYAVFLGTILIAQAFLLKGISHKKNQPQQS